MACKGHNFWRLALAFYLYCVVAGPAWSEEWRGWRGVEREGRAAGRGPIHWSAERNVAWKTAIPGRGFSSPIVTETTVYVTTGRIVRADPTLLIGVRIVVLVGLFVLTAFTLYDAARQSSQIAGGEGRLRRLVSVSAQVLSLLLLCALVLFAESALDFDRAVERPWIAGALVATLSLTLAGDGGNTRRGRICALSLIALSVILAVAIPDWKHTVGQSPCSAVSLLIYAVILLPALVGSRRLTNRDATKTDVTEGASGAPAPRMLRVVARLIALGAGASGALVALALVRQEDETRRTVTGSSYDPSLQGPVLWFPALLLGSILLYGLVRKASPGRSLAAVLAAAVLGLMLLGAAMEQLLARVSYLSYLLGTPDETPLMGWAALITLVGVGLAVLTLAFFRTRRNSSPPAPAGGRVPVWLAGGFALLYFVYANYVPKEPMLERAVVALDRRTGALQWISQGLRAAQGILHSDNSPATPTPVTDGERIYAYFGTPGLLCTDLRGRKLWANTGLPFETRQGVATSPVLWQGRVIILSESDSGNYLAAVDGGTGKLLWRTERTQKKSHSYAGNCRTPTVESINGQPTIVVWGQEDLSGYDPTTGRELWSKPLGKLGNGDNPVASLVTDAARFYVAGTQRAFALSVADLPGKGDAIAWKSELDDGIQCSSPVLQQGLLFAVSDGGSAFCLDTATGRELWRHDLYAQHYASPVATNDHVYFCSTEGRTTVLGCERGLRVVAQNDLLEGIYASPVLLDGQLFLRTTGHLYCIKQHR